MADILYSHEKYQSMLAMLEAYQDAGILLYLSGEHLSARDIAYTCTVKECNSYMSDYVPDSSGQLREIHFDSVTPKKAQRRYKKNHRKMAI